MPGRTSDSRKRVDHFQRRKVGSIRDNPKLMKIRQQFENASKEEDLPKANTFCELLNIDLKLSRVEGFQVRRHSEGEDSLHVNRNSVKASKFFSSPSVDEKSLVGVEALTKTLVCESNSDKFCISKGLENVSPPPLPKRGVSPATQSFLLAPTSSPKRQNLLSKEPSGKETSVQKAIELYEGMSSSSPKKNKSAKNYGSHHKIVKREETFSKRIHKRRSSFRRSKLPSDCPPAPVSQKEETSDCEEGNQNVYQTLSTFPASLDDPYDRLNRIHDVLHQIHEGQTSACAACKAIPSIKLRDSAILEVKCHEVSPHHHPPCICFSCQHSVFSCSVLQAKQEDDLYYNLCCLNLPNRESWRQSRRRPVCEQNGRLCVVNCDIEKSAKIDSSQKEYENLSNCHSMSPRQKDTAKQMNGESYESDEGWVDVTDSEDEKSSPLSERTIHPPLDDQNLSLEIVDIIAECSDLKLTDACSTEHLYESISEIESQEPVASSKDDPVPENELDSGEWSTESSSPVFNESFEKNNRQNAFSRYTVSGEETSKKTFMKSVLGKRTKKRRMSNFFVPWLVSNNEYCVTTDASNYKPSTKLSSRSSKRNLSSKETCCKNVESDKSSKMLPESPEDPPSFSSSLSRNSSVSYVRADELESVEFPKQRKTSLPGIVDVSVERVCRHSGNSEHTYILFTPIKEDQVPLYQFYERNVKERVSFCRSGSKNLSPIMWIPEASSSEAKSPQLSVVEQLSPEAADIKMLWCELPEVKESGILERISAQELKLQEGIFEFIQSQASYVRSLKVLYENFIQAPEFSSVLSKHEQDVLFSDIIHLKEVSDRILYDVTARWGDSILIPDICDIILHHAQLPSFSIYVKYCSNRVYQERTLKELKESRMCFLEALRKLESHPICQGLGLESFLFLPMQHVARLPLLLDNIFRWLSPGSVSYATCKDALEAVHKIFIECNESARKMERLEEMFVLNKQLEFKECKVIPLISASRWLLKKGELMKLEFDKKTFGRSNRCVRVSVFIFLFNDLLVVTKRKNDDCYTVVDYCFREKVQATAINAKDLQQPLISPNICRYLIYLKLLSNHQNLPTDMILNCTLLSERTRWIEAINSAGQNKPCEIWEYDCPQVQCFKNYIAQQPDELSLQESDVVTVHRKMNDGWYEGRRLRDGLQGWFPASHTMDIPCSRARASNLRQCYRLLMLSHHKS